MDDVGSENELVREARTWRDLRLQRIANRRDLTFEIDNSPRLVVHLQPLKQSPFACVDLASMVSASFSPWLSSYDHVFTVDGFLAIQVIPQAPTAGDYVQVFHTGAIEATDAMSDFPPHTKSAISAASCEEKVSSSVPVLCALQQTLGIPLPVMVSMSLIGVQGRNVATGSMGHRRELNFWKSDLVTDIITLPEARIDLYPSDPRSIVSYLRVTLNALWNAGGLPKSPRFIDQEK